MSPIFRLSFRVELARPSDDPETIDGGIPLEQSQDQNARRTLKQSIRQHPRFSLRITALIALSLGIILNAVIYSIYGRRYYTVRQLTGVAEVVMILSLAHHLTDIYTPHALPSWAFITIDVLGFLLLGTLFGFNCAAIDQMLGPYYRSEAAVLLAYNSGIWVVCLIVHAAVIAQCIAHRSRSCPHPSPSPTADEEVAVPGIEAAPESSLLRYRDEEIEDSTAHS